MRNSGQLRRAPTPTTQRGTHVATSASPASTGVCGGAAAAPSGEGCSGGAWERMTEAFEGSTTKDSSIALKAPIPLGCAASLASAPSRVGARRRDAPSAVARARVTARRPSHRTERCWEPCRLGGATRRCGRLALRRRGCPAAPARPRTPAGFCRFDNETQRAQPLPRPHDVLGKLTSHALQRTLDARTGRTWNFVSRSMGTRDAAGTGAAVYVQASVLAKKKSKR